MANSCKAIAMLGCYPDYVCDAAFRYGMHVGVAFQLVDDMLDYEGREKLPTLFTIIQYNALSYYSPRHHFYIF